jgi:hypothetical protein
MTDEPLNREQRRAARFRPKAGRVDPHAVGGPVADEIAAPDGDDAEAFTGGAGTDVTRLAGAGTGGATEDDGRVTNREGIHLGNQPSS